MSETQQDDRRVVPIDEAIQRIGKKRQIHTLIGGPGMLIGADHDRKSLIANMRKHGVEDAGPEAAGMGHTLVIVKYPTWDEARTTPLFIEAAPRVAGEMPSAT